MPLNRIDLGRIVYCPAARTDLTIDYCTRQYADARAIGNKATPCHDCRQGERLRRLLARDAGVPPSSISAR